MMQAQKLAELAVRLLRRRWCTVVQPWLRWRALLGRFVDKLRDASPRQPNTSSTSKAWTSGRGPSESPGEMVQVCLSAGRDAAFFRRLPWDMPISDVKRLLLAAWCSNLGDQAKPPDDVAAGIQRLWHETWLKCSGRSLDEESTLRASNVGADATIALQVRLRGGGICMSKTANVRVAPLDTRPPDVAQEAVALAVREAEQTFDARQQRLEAGTAPCAPVAGSLEALYRQIGHQVPRNARDQWKEKLEAPPTLELKPRNAEQDMWILRGKLGEKGGAVRIEVLREDKRIVCFLLSSTFTDTASERNLLIADVVPYLQQYARKYNFDFRLVEMRWGIRAEASSAHQTSEICMAELERCQRESQGFSYVFLG
jgi:hypothetical protein